MKSVYHVSEHLFTMSPNHTPIGGEGGQGPGEGESAFMPKKCPISIDRVSGRSFTALQNQSETPTPDAVAVSSMGRPLATGSRQWLE